MKWDMEDQNLCPHLWLFQNPQNPTLWMLPHANFVLTEWELTTFRQRFKSLKIPSNYSSSTTNHMLMGRFGVVKAYDWHVFMQQFLPLCLRGLMQENTCTAIMCLSWDFWQICTKDVNPNEIPKLKGVVVTTLCMLEMEMPLAFFDVMTHLVLHLIEEFDLCGPISTFWMYCIKRMNKVMKGYMRCMQQLEGCMVKGYVMKVSMGFIT